MRLNHFPRIFSGLLLLALFLAGCTADGPEVYQDRSPTLRLEDYFLGSTQAWGILQDRNGQVRRQIRIQMHGSLEADTLVLTQDLSYADGAQEQRVWRIRPLDAHRYAGTADDLEGVASGSAYGNAAHWRYQLPLEIEGIGLVVDWNDWMFLQADGVLINRIHMSKYGVKLGEFTLVWHKMPQSLAQPASEASAPPAPPPATPLDDQGVSV